MKFWFRDGDEIDDQIVDLTKEVSRFAFPEHGEPTEDTITTGLKDIIGDTFYNAVGSVTVRKIAEKVKA